METMKEMLGPEHPSTLTSMANLASTYQNQGRWTEAEELLEQVLETRKTVLGAKHPATLTSMANLASTYRNQGRWIEAEELLKHVVDTSNSVLSYKDTGAREDLERAIIVAQETANAVSKDHPGRAGILTNLSSQLGMRFERTGAMEDLERAISIAQEAIDTIPEDHPDRTLILSILSAQLGMRFERTGSMKDLERAISIAQGTVNAISKDHPGRAGILSNLGSQLRMRFERTGAMEDLESAINVSQEAIDTIPQDHPGRAMILDILSTQFRLRFERTGEMKDLEHAINFAHEAVAITPQGHPDRAIFLNNLGTQLGLRFKKTGAVKHLDRAINHVQEAIETFPQDHPGRVGILSNLSSQLGMRFERTGAMEDLEKAISIAQEAINTFPQDHPGRAGILKKLSSQLKMRFERTGAMEDLEKAISIAQEAIDAIPGDHPDRAQYLNNLGAQLRLRFEGTGAVEDLETATYTLEQAVTTISKDHPDREEILDNLRAHLISTYEMTGAKQDLQLIRLPCAAQAAFNSFDNQHKPLCLPGTRVDVLKQINTWAHEQSNTCIFWLSGMAGSGKSTIARTVSRAYCDQNLLGASFFFSRGGGDVDHAGKFFTSIAVQLASKSPALKRKICEAIAEQGDIAKKGLEDHWKHLILQPLSKLLVDSVQSPLLLVVDALDECESDNDIRLIIQLLAEARNLENIQLRIFLTSRPEVSVRHGFHNIQESMYHGLVLHSKPQPVIDHDISIFFEQHLGVIKWECSLPADWPGAQTIDALVRKADGLFIWASTACRFIKDGKMFAPRRLVQILQRDTANVPPEEQLDKIYREILANSVKPEYNDEEKVEFCTALREILGTIVILFSPLSSISLAGLLDIPMDSIYQTLDDVHSILEVPKDQGQPLRLHHPSFRDFLLDKQKCHNKSFWLDEQQAQKALVDCSIRIMSNKLKKDICVLRAPGTLVTKVKSHRIEQFIPAELQYACQYWIEHLQRSNIQPLDNGNVHRFLKMHLLHWLEALSLMRKISEGVLAISSLESIVAVSGL